jgi:hypothetical protein
VGKKRYAKRLTLCVVCAVICCRHLLLAMTLRATTDISAGPRFAAPPQTQLTVIATDSSEQLFDHEANTPTPARILSGSARSATDPVTWKT